ncbi:hypothetical protein BC829DRAFT_70821 [Chytridium lagenaria]|nr:hypothetical protein BC829DRAFT_70821 [Chytridium lagenaria]
MDIKKVIGHAHSAKDSCFEPTAQELSGSENPIVDLCAAQISGSRVLDSVSTEYEDSFCLESFGDLITYHAESEPKGEKAFIIARVQTWDPKQPDKAFYSYYDAFQLNKILFQTQVYLGKKLIHRLHVLNPLTNTDIIGNVQYFMVKGSRVEGAKPKTIDIPIVEKSAPLKESPTFGSAR